MPNRLADAVSPYLRSHADNPVDWREWGQEAFAEAAERNVPVLVSIGYSTCHWCHVMARESFSDPQVAQELNDGFVSIKVDREEYPDVDTSYLAAAAAFTQNLGWPLNVFVTPEGRAFYAGTYFPPEPLQGHASFRQILAAVREAWVERHDEVQQNAAAVAGAISAQLAPDAGTLPGGIAPVVDELATYEDAQFGGFGGAPKFPVAPVLNFLLASGQPDGVALANRTLERMARSPLRDAVEGGFFRYSTMRDWSDPHYERMLYDNAQLLDAYTRAHVLDTGRHGQAADVAAGVAGFLLGVLQLPSGGFASAQDSESLIDGRSSEGGYYKLTAEERAVQPAPKLDEKVLSGWNGLAIAALSRAGVTFARADWIDGARRAADYLLEQHVLGDRLVRASIDGRVSAARATLEDYGMLAGGLLQLALATGEARYATVGRALLDATLAPSPTSPFSVPGGADPVLAAQGVAIAVDPSEGAYPSGLSACALAAETLHSLTGESRYREAASATAALVAGQAAHRPIGFGATLEVLARLAHEAVQLVVVVPDAEPDPASELLAAARAIPATVTAIVSEAQASEFAAEGFELFEGRTARDGRPTAYLCRDFVCRLPVTDAAALAGS